jgi:hypothetical protein
MSTAAQPGRRSGPGRLRMFVQALGGVVLGLGLAAAVGLDPSVLFALYTIPRGDHRG